MCDGHDGPVIIAMSAGILFKVVTKGEVRRHTYCPSLPAKVAIHQCEAWITIPKQNCLMKSITQLLSLEVLEMYTDCRQAVFEEQTSKHFEDMQAPAACRCCSAMCQLPIHSPSMVVSPIPGRARRQTLVCRLAPS